MRVLAFASVGILASLALVLAGSDARAYDCGPGAHWVDTCAAGLDVMPATGAVVGIDTLFDGNLDEEEDVSVVMGGPTTIQRQAAGDDSANFPLMFPVDGHLDVIDTEIVSLSLTGGGIKLWAGQGPSPNSGVVLDPSFGTIFEQGGNASLADSFFDVFFEVDLGGGVFVYNHDLLRIETVDIPGVPPIPQEYIHPEGVVWLWTLPVGGDHIANLVTAVHITPEPGTGFLLGAGLIALAAARRRQRRR
jgi:hypothetical protein